MSVTDPGSPVIRLAARGDGVTADGRFVALAAPGDLVQVDGTVIPGPNHVTPPCRHFPECGGCQMQHVADAAYAQWMGERIAHALGTSGVAIGQLMPAHLSPPRSRRRATLKAVRQGSAVMLGFHVEGTHRVLDLHECWVLRPELFALVAPLRPLLASLLCDGDGSGVSLTLTDTGIDALISNVASGPRAWAAVTAFAATHDLARLSIEGAGGIETVALARAPAVRLGGAVVEVPPAPFLQATADGEAALVAAVLAAGAGAAQVADLFCGLGTFALPLAAAAKHVTAVDAAGPAIAALARAGGTRVRVATEHRDLFRRPLTPQELSRFDAVVFDPPRAGAKAQVAELARSTVPRVVAVSCNAATFARDAAALVAGGYQLGRLWPIGQFRWSNHVELVAEFVR